MEQQANAANQPATCGVNHHEFSGSVYRYAVETANATLDVTQIPDQPGAQTELHVPVSFDSGLWCQLCPPVKWNVTVSLNFIAAADGKSHRLDIELLSSAPDATTG